MENEYYEITIGSTNRSDLEWIFQELTVGLSWANQLDVENIIQRCEHGVNITYDTCDDAPCTPSGYSRGAIAKEWLAIWRHYKSL